MNAAVQDLGFAFDWRNPDYTAIYQWRANRLAQLRRNPKLLKPLIAYYRDHPADFISEWGTTFDPRNAEVGLPTLIPFVVWPRQREWIDWAMGKWRVREPGLTEKSRDSGVSWLAIALSCTLCLFYRGLAIGFGSRKAEYVDSPGIPKSLFEKARIFMENLPPEFRGSWTRKDNATYMRVMFPATQSVISGECGDGIGRGDRTSIYFVDEAAFLERPNLTEAALSNTTNCRIDISTPNGYANPFAIKRHAGRISVFTFHWTMDPRKDQKWYEKQVREASNPLVVAREIDINYASSLEGVVIPAAWIQSSINALYKLGLESTGLMRGGLDVADEGIDQNAFAGRHGPNLVYLNQWSGEGGDIFKTVQKTFGICEEQGIDGFDYDADGLGAGVRGDARVINEARQNEGKGRIFDTPFRGSGAVDDPEGEQVPQILNKNNFGNLKAQSWWWLRDLFQNTHRAVTEPDYEYDPERLISLDPDLELLPFLIMELSQPTYTLSPSGKILIDKRPDGLPSPNLADAVMICYNPQGRDFEAWGRL